MYLYEKLCFLLLFLTCSDRLDPLGGMKVFEGKVPSAERSLVCDGEPEVEGA